MTRRVFTDLVQGSDEWLEARRGIVTASVVGQLITARTVKPAHNEYSRALTHQLVAERITGWVEPVYVNHDMLRGTLDEPIARNLYAENWGPVTEVGFVTEDKWGFTIGASPDGLVGDDGIIEIKSRKPKAHLATILADEVPAENLAQIQCLLLVSGREWCHYVSFCGGMPLWLKCVYASERWHDAIFQAVEAFEHAAEFAIAKYTGLVAGLPATERIDHFAEIIV